MLTKQLNQQEALVVEKLYCENKTPKQAAEEMFMSTSRIYQIRARALAKIRFGNKPLPKLTSICKINLERLLDER